MAAPRSGPNFRPVASGTAPALQPRIIPASSAVPPPAAPLAAVHNRSAQPRAGLAALQRGGALPAAANVSRASGAQLSQQQQQQQQQQYEAELTDEQRSEITESFNLFDLDQDGRIDILEFKTACKALGFDMQKDELRVAMNKFGTFDQESQQRPGRRKVYLNQANFESFIAPKVAAKDPQDEVLRSFDLFDQEGKGYLTADDIRRVADELGERITPEEIQSMIEEFDMDGDGAIGRDDFLEICMN